MRKRTGDRGRTVYTSKKINKSPKAGSLTPEPEINVSTTEQKDYGSPTMGRKIINRGVYKRKEVNKSPKPRLLTPEPEIEVFATEQKDYESPSKPPLYPSTAILTDQQMNNIQLRAAIAIANIDLVKYHLDEGAQPNDREPTYGKTALHYVVAILTSAEAKIEVARDIINLLLDFKAEINARDKRLFTILDSVRLLVRTSETPEKFTEIIDLLESKGGKSGKEL